MRLLSLDSILLSINFRKPLKDGSMWQKIPKISCNAIKLMKKQSNYWPNSRTNNRCISDCCGFWKKNLKRVWVSSRWSIWISSNQMKSLEIFSRTAIKNIYSSISKSSFLRKKQTSNHIIRNFYCCTWTISFSWTKKTINKS